MSEQCGAYRYGEARCERQSKEMALNLIPLCKIHLADLERAMAGERIKAFAEARDLFLPPAVYVRPRLDQGFVYFIGAGRRIKIGQSQNPERRLLHIRGGYTTKTPKGLNTTRAKLIATEPGGQRRERELHQQFAHLRVAGEWFDNKDELRHYIESLAQQQAA
jgi:hypothetical protein